MDWTTLAIQTPIVAAFIWFALELNKRSQVQQDAFLAALDRRDEMYEKRNAALLAQITKSSDATIDALEKQTAQIASLTERFAQLQAVQGAKVSSRSG